MKERVYKKAVKFVSFSFVGTTTFAMQLFFTLLFTELFGIVYYISHAMALVIAWTMHFVFNMKITFAVRDDVPRRLGRFTIIALSSSIINWLLVLVAVESFGAHYFISILLVTVLLSVLTFTSEELWVFRKVKMADAHGIEK
ncbi:GtrA family protein [Nanoarchaeota archaeon]